MSIIHYIEYPAPDDSVVSKRKPIKGWVSASDPIERIEVSCSHIRDKNVQKTRRDDVEKHNQADYQHHTGFETSLKIADFIKENDDGNVTIEFFLGDGSCEKVQVSIGSKNISEAKARKLDLISSLLACPECHVLLQRDNDTFTCTQCSIEYPYNGNSVDFLTEAFKKDFSIEPTDNVSAWNYDLEIMKIIEKNPDKMFLDCGAGLRKTYYDNVINFEIVNYKSTDVLGVGEKLPFADNSLDGVFSVAVLEHVKNPFLCAREIERVIKPGGLLFCAAAFMQPVHAYPHHYYNMSALGLRNLFENMEIKKEQVPLALHPAKSIAWMLRSYRDGLPRDTRRLFLDMTIKDFIELDLIENLHTHPVMTQLSEETQREIAGGNAIIATKK